MNRKTFSEFSLVLPDIGLGLFSATRVTTGAIESLPIVSFKGHFVSEHLLSDSSLSLWHLAGWPDQASDVELLGSTGDIGFVGDADPSSIIQYLNLRSLVEENFGRHGRTVWWLGIDSEWIRFVSHYLGPGWSTESLSIAMPTDELAVWRELRRHMGADLSQWLGHELIDWLEREKKFEVEAFAHRNSFFINYKDMFQDFITKRAKSVEPRFRLP